VREKGFSSHSKNSDETSARGCQGQEDRQGHNRYHACQTLAAEGVAIEPQCLDLPANLNPWDYARSANAEQRHLAPGTPAVIFKFFARASTAWEEQRGKAREEANRKRSKAVGEIAAKRGRTERGTFEPGPVSSDTTPGPTVRERDKGAHAARVSSATTARAQAVVAHRPDLAEKVRAGHITLSVATREMKRAAIDEGQPGEGERSKGGPFIYSRWLPLSYVSLLALSALTQPIDLSGWLVAIIR